MRTAQILWEFGLPAMAFDLPAFISKLIQTLSKRPQKRPLSHENGHCEVVKDRRKTIKFRLKNSNL
jgi:hypothetical protein